MFQFSPVVSLASIILPVKVVFIIPSANPVPEFESGVTAIS
jgi:hypothetical protein